MEWSLLSRDVVKFGNKLQFMYVLCLCMRDIVSCHCTVYVVIMIAYLGVFTVGGFHENDWSITFYDVPHHKVCIGTH